MRNLPGDIDWDSTFRRLAGFALRRLGSRGSIADAEELAQEAIRRSLDPDYAAWDPAKYPEFDEYLGSLVNGLVRNLATKKATLAESPEPPDSAVFATAHVAESMNPEARAADGEIVERAISMIAERINGRPLLEDIFLMGCADGIVKAADQAAKLGRPVSQIYEARRELERHVTEVEEILYSEVLSGS